MPRITKYDKLNLYADLYRDGCFDGLDLNPKQEKALKKLTDKKTISILFGGGANGGKSWLGCLWSIMNAIAYPGTRWFIGRDELKKVRQYTLPSFYLVWKYLGLPIDAVNYNGADNYFGFYNESRIDCLDLAYRPSDPLYERFGSSLYTGGWIEEAGEVHHGANAVLKTRVGRYKNDENGLIRKLFITCNPKKNWLYREFYIPWRDGKMDEYKAFIQSLVGDNPRRESGSMEQLQQISDPVQKQRLLFGNWEYDDDPSALMNYDAITDIFTNVHIQPGEKADALTCDVARFGNDLSILRLWSGWCVTKTETYSGKNTSFIANRIVRLQQEHGFARSRTVIDDDGVGGGVVDQIPGSIGFVNNSRSVKVNGKDENYQNLKSQCTFRFAERINRGEIRIMNCTDEERERTIDDCESVKRNKPDSDGKLSVVPKDKMKEELGRSPDFWDSLMMREYLELKPKARVFNKRPSGF